MAGRCNIPGTWFSSEWVFTTTALTVNRLCTRLTLQHVDMLLFLNEQPETSCLIYWGLNRSVYCILRHYDCRFLFCSIFISSICSFTVKSSHYLQLPLINWFIFSDSGEAIRLCWLCSVLGDKMWFVFVNLFLIIRKYLLLFWISLKYHSVIVCAATCTFLSCWPICVGYH